MRIVIIYSSGGGNTLLVVQKVSEIISELTSHTVTIKQAIVATKEDITNADCLIFASPTYDHGILHAPFERFLDTIATESLNKKSCTVIGLGDNKYDHEYTLQSVTILQEFMEKHDGVIIMEPLRIHKSPLPYLETTIPGRTQQLIVNLN